MKIRRWIVGAVALAANVLVAGSVGSVPVSPLGGISLKVPKTWPCGELSRGDVKALWLEGEPHKGRPTKVFAYVVLPKGASAANRVPGMVLAHGGAGSAYPGWAAGWAEKGYAAIIPDTCGCIPMKAPGVGWMRSGVGGPEGWGRADLVDEPVGDQWPYHAVGAVIRAHSYLRSLPEVDADRIGITGISWGGFITQLAAATDCRFRFAAPVYACGFYEEFAEYTDFYRRPSFTLGMGQGPEADRLLVKWASLFDPKLYVPKVKVPLFWFASAGDRAFPFDTLQKTVRLAPGARLSVRVGMKHGHGKVGDSMPELYRFADRVLRDGPDLPTVGVPSVKDGVFSVACDAKGCPIRRVDFIWCTDAKPVSATKWQTQTYALPADGHFSAPVPANATRVFANFIFGDELKEAYYPDAIISSTAVKL